MNSLVTHPKFLYENFFQNYTIDKKIVHLIANEKNIRKYDFNKNLKATNFIVKQKSKNLVYKQVRVEGKAIWVYVINKKRFKRAMEEIEYGR